jgi:membrane-associated phospholipid phosphatase
MISAYAVLTVMMVASGLLMTHVLAHGTAGRWDDHVNAWFVAHRGTLWDGASGDAAFVANTAGIVVVAALVTVVLLLRKWGRRALLVASAVVVEFCVFLTCDYLVARPRPHVSHLGSTPSTFSWPSGRAAATFVVYGGIAVLITARTKRPIARIAAWLVAVSLTAAVAMSRIYRGDHHPTDAIAGVILGIAAVWSATTALRVADGAETARRVTPTPADTDALVRTRGPAASGEGTREPAAAR